MSSAVKIKSHYGRKSEEFLLQRKIKLFFSRLFKIIQILLLLALTAFAIWWIWFGGNEIVKSKLSTKTNETFVNIGVKTKSIEIIGNSVVSDDEIVKAIFTNKYEAPKTSLVTLDLDKIKNKLLKKGWIAEVHLKKKMPDTLLVAIKERKPEVIWQSDGQLWLADNEGNKITQDISKIYLDLPYVLGENSQSDITELYSIITSSPYLFSQFNGAERVGQRRWDVELKNGILVKLPENNPEYAWKKLAETDKEKEILSKDISYIDLRIEGQIIVGM